MSDQTLADLENLLRDEREILLKGDYDSLEPIASIKEELFAKFGELSSRLDPRRVETIKQDAEHNRELLAAAARGLKSVTRKLAEIRSAHGPLNTYSKAGERQTLGARGGAFEKRA